ncbi:MAG TPA: hypothetical protein VGZ02_01670 [Candidatus Baltobacteraceae bacterium]|nr:hypothetical protein [Candidatus Baltobacteraceae bacterium]
MEKRNERDLVGHPSDYGSRTLSETADGEPQDDRGSADSALTGDEDDRADETARQKNPDR